MATDNRKALNVELDPDVRDKLSKFIPWGMLRPTVSAMMTTLANLLDSNPEHRTMILGGIAAGTLRITFTIEHDATPSDEGAVSSAE